MKSSFVACPGSKACVAALSTLLFACWLAAPGSLKATEEPPFCSLADGGTGNTSQGGINFNLTQAHVGDTVPVFPSLGMAARACEAINATGVVYIATGPLTNFLVNVTLPQNVLISCPAGASCQPGPYNLLITPALVGAPVNTPLGGAPGVPKTVRAAETGFGTVLAGEVDEQLSDLHTASIQIVTPCIRVFKVCDLPPLQDCFAAETPVRFRGYVTNCGDITLTNVTVIDNRAGQLQLLNPASGSPLSPPFSLAPGAYAVFTNSFQPTLQETCAGSATNVAIATATDVTTIGGPHAFVSDSYTDVCPICVIPAITVTKQCPPGILQPGQLLVYSGVVSNAGNITLTNVIVVNNQPSNNAPVLGPITLVPGASLAFTNSYMVPLDSCGPYVDMLTAQANTTCGAPVGNTALASCAFTNTPSIDVVKLCPPNPVQPGGLMVVTGTVTNTGNVTLTNVVVTNSISALGISRQVLGPISLAPGAGTNFSDSYVVPLDSCGPYADTFTAQGADKCFGVIVSDFDTKACAGTNTPSIDVVKVCPPNPVQPGGLMVVTGTVTNTGNVTLTNVVVTNSISALGISRQVLGPISLAPGAGTSFSDNYIVPLDSCGPYADTFTAQGADKCFGVIVSDFDTKACAGTNTPSIDVVKVCPPNPVQPGGLMVVTGTVTNTGNVTLTNVVVTNSISALGISRQVLGPISLAPGAGTSFSDNYIVPLDSCGPYTDTFTAQGADKCFGVIVTDFDTKSCAGTNSPRIEVTKNCPPVPTAPGQITTISGVVSNAGNVTLTNVIVVDDQPAINTVLLGPTNLIPGQTISFTNSYRLPPNSCTCVDTVIASGSDKCFGKTVTDSASAVCPNATDPRISVTKICPPLPVALGEPLIFSGVVSNAGNITLTNVTVVDNQPSNNTPVFGPVTLAPGETANFIGAYVVPIDICDTNILDTVTAHGNNLCNGATVSASQSALCPILPTPRLVVTKNCPVDPVPPGGLLSFSGTVSNAGTITLTNVMVFNDHPTNDTPLLGPITLAPNQWTNFSGSYQVCTECCPPYVDTITAAGAQICNGSNVTATATAYCPGITTPKLSLTVNCPPDPGSQGQLLIYSGSVSNAGDVALGDILVTDDKAGFVTEILALAPGETEEFVGFFVPTNCGPNLVTLVSATALDVCTGGSVSNQVSASCLVICPTNQPPNLIGPTVHTNVFTFSFGTQQGLTYTVQYTDSLSPVNWQTLTSFIGDGSVKTITDTVASNQQRFYRVLVQ